MKKVTEIKVGQIWVSKLCSAPIKILKANAHRVEFGWWHGGYMESDNYCVNDLKLCYDLVADSMHEEDFKQWCMTGENPTLKSETEIKSTENDPVHHPSHYTSHPSGIARIEITRHMIFNIDNAIQDLQKAVWHTQDEIKRLEGGE